MTDKPFLVIWESDRHNVLSADDLARLSLDPESWANFLWLLLRRRRFAVMRMHDGRTKRVEGTVKVVWRTETGDIPKYASLT